VPYSGEREAIIAESNRLAQVQSRLQQTQGKLQRWTSDWLRRKEINDYEYVNNKVNLDFESSIANFNRIIREHDEIAREGLRLQQSTQSFLRDAKQYEFAIARLRERANTLNRVNRAKVR
jgi:hypothetical protein